MNATLKEIANVNWDDDVECEGKRVIYDLIRIEESLREEANRVKAIREKLKTGEVAGDEFCRALSDIRYAADLLEEVWATVDDE